MFFNNIKAQINIITDGSFEDTTLDYQLYSGEGTLQKWHSLNNSYYSQRWLYYTQNRILDTNFLRLPNNSWVRNLYPKHGNGVVLLENFQIPVSLPWPSIRSVIRSKLRTKLTSGKQYCVKIYMQSSDTPLDYFTNGLGLYFDNGQLDTIVNIHHDSSGIYPFVQPQVQCTFLINDTSNWMKLESNFIANGTEEYVTIGNFLSDSALNKQFIGWTNCVCQHIVIEDVSLIPIDLHDWLHDTFYTIGDSVWVGLNQFDYSEGVWYNSNMHVIDTSTGFWYKPEAASTQFIQGVEVCGVMHYDTMTVYAYPLSNVQFTMNPNRVQLKVFPNPAANCINIVCLSFLNNQEKLQILDITGKQLLHIIPTKNEMVIDISSLAKGVYFVKYGSENMQFVKE